MRRTEELTPPYLPPQAIAKLAAWMLVSGVAMEVVRAQPVPVAKTNPMKVYMHYMPWFDTPQTLGGSTWGFHWKMNTQNPNVVDSQGRRQIASYSYPKIGPYASSDPTVIEYHLLLLKYAGVDGAILDWYGAQGTNGDISQLLQNSNAFIGKVDDFGLQFGAMLEDRFAANVSQASANVAYLRDNYFNNPAYIRIGAGADPLLPVFGPITFQTPSQWTQILTQAGEDVALLPLWYESLDAGTNADGEFAWIYQDAAHDYAWHQANFYQSRARSLDIAGGSAFPGFRDFYAQGGAGASLPFVIPYNSGNTLSGLLSLANTWSSRIDFLQLNTFNDFGEGTMFEPTVEFGFQSLKQIQQFTGVPYSETELQLVFDLYRARKAFVGNSAAQSLLNQASANLAALQVPQASAIIEGLLLPADFEDDQQVDGRDFLLWQRQVGSVGYYPLSALAADGNADSIVNGGDLAVWQQQYGTHAWSPVATSVSEPSSGVILIAMLMASCRRKSRR